MPQADGGSGAIEGHPLGDMGAYVGNMCAKMCVLRLPSPIVPCEASVSPIDRGVPGSAGPNGHHPRCPATAVGPRRRVASRTARGTSR